MNIPRRLVRLVRQDRFAFGAALLCGLGGGVLTISQAVFFSRLVNDIFLGGRLLAAEQGLIGLLLGILLLRAVVTWAGEVSSSRLAVTIKAHLRRDLFDSLLRRGPAFTRREQTGELANTLSEGVEAVGQFYSQYLPQLILAALIPISILIFIFPGDLLSGAILLVTGPLIPLFMYLIGRTAESLTKRQWTTLSRLGAYFYDSLQGLTVLKEFGQSHARAGGIAEASEHFRQATLQVLRVTFLSALALELLSTVSTAMVAVEVSLRLLYGHLAFQQAFFLLLLIPEFYLPLRLLGTRFHAGMNAVTAARRLFGLLDKKPAHPSSTADALDPASFSSLRLENVTYTYPGESASVLQDINLELHSGEQITIAGPSGAGKTTLSALLLGFIQPQAGRLCLNEQPFSPSAACDLIAWLPQFPHLFHDTLAANLRVARPNADEAEMERALQAAKLLDFLKSLPAGLETVLGEAGARLSGGEARRLALARAYLKDAPILLLDEPAASLDPINESLFQQSLSSLAAGRTVITLAHSPQRKGRLFLLENGRLSECDPTRMLETKIDPLEDIEPVTVPAKSITLLPGNTAVTASTGRDLLRLLSFLKGSWGWVILSILLGVLTVGSNVGLMGTAAWLIAASALRPEFGVLQLAIVGVRFFGLARGGFRYAERLVSHDVTFRLLSRLRTWFYRALEPLAPARLMEHSAGDLLARILADVTTLENLYVRAIAPPLSALLVTAGLSLYFGMFSTRLALVYAIFMVAVGLVLPLLSWWLSRQPGAAMITRRASFQMFLVDGIQGLPDLLSFGQGQAYASRLDEENRLFGSAQTRLASINGLSNGLGLLLSNAGMLAVFILAVPLFHSGQMAGPWLAVLALAALAGFEAVLPLSQAAQSLVSSLAAGRRLFEIVDAEPAVPDLATEKQKKAGDPGLELFQVGFHYPGEGVRAIKDVTFKLAPGMRIAIVGPSGAGKSSLAQLLLRYSEPQQGSIFLGDRNVRLIPQEWVRENFAVVAQRVILFNDTIRNNLLIANVSASQKELQQVLELADLEGLVNSLPKGLETVIEEAGMRLSGGERQRLAIARALLRGTPILLLDEPFAHLDSTIAQRIMANLLALKDRSMLLITHRLIGMEFMDETLVMDCGQIVERGRHADLLDQRGLYSRLWISQNRQIEENIDK